MDVKTMFLDRYLEKDFYMEQSLGFTSSDGDYKVCKLQRSIKASFSELEHLFQ